MEKFIFNYNKFILLLFYSTSLFTSAILYFKMSLFDFINKFKFYLLFDFINICYNIYYFYVIMILKHKILTLLFLY
jgi:hypothetical protein